MISSTWTFNLAVFINFFVTLGVYPSYFTLAETTSTNTSWDKASLLQSTKNTFAIFACCIQIRTFDWDFTEL